MPTVTFKCAECGKEKTTYRAPSSKNPPRYCCRECMYRAWRTKPAYTFECERCGVQKTVPLSPNEPRPRFCCLAHYHAWQAENPTVNEMYDWTPERDTAIRKAYRDCETATEALDKLNADPLFADFPFWMLKYRAGYIGCAKTTRGSEWTKEEEAIVRSMVGNHRVSSIAKRLRKEGFQRSTGAVASHCETLRISTKMARGLTLQETAEAFGVSPRTVTKWVRQKRLHGLRLGEGDTTPWIFSDRALKRFIQDNPLEVSKGKPNIVWLIGMLVPVGQGERKPHEKPFS